MDDPIKPEEAMPSLKRESVAEWFDDTLYSCWTANAKT